MCYDYNYPDCEIPPPPPGGGPGPCNPSWHQEGMYQFFKVEFSWDPEWSKYYCRLYSADISFEIQNEPVCPGNVSRNVCGLPFDEGVVMSTSWNGHSMVQEFDWPDVTACCAAAARMRPGATPCGG